MFANKEKRSDVVWIISDIIFSTSYVVFSMSDAVSSVSVLHHLQGRIANAMYATARNTLRKQSKP